MTEMQEPPSLPTSELTTDELELIGTALRLLLSTLGREEADQIEEVQALLGKLQATSP